MKLAAGDQGSGTGSHCGSEKLAELRKKAEAHLKGRILPSPIALPDDLLNLIHELEVHQVELDLQNDELWLAQQEMIEAREELHGERSKYRDLFDLAPVGYLALDVSGLIREINLAAAEMLGVERGHLIGSGLSRFFSPEHAGLLYDMRRPALDAELSRTQDVCITRGDGSGLWVQAKMWSGLGQDGRTVFYWLVFIDNSQRKKLERELGEKTDVLRTIFDNLPYIAMVVNQDGRVIDINHAGVGFAGGAKRELLGLLDGEVLKCLNSFDGQGCGRNPQCEDCPIRTSVTQTLVTGDSVSNAEGRLKFAKGAQTIHRDFLISTCRLKTGDGDSALISLNDVSDSTLAQDIAMRMETNLLEKQKMQELGTLASGMAHDFNNILGSILINSQLAQEGLAAGSETLALLDLVQEGCLNARNIIKRIMNYSLKSIGPRACLDMHRATLDSLELLRSLVPSTVAFDVSIQVDTGIVRCTASEVHQILLNLVNNGVQAMPPKGRIGISLSPEFVPDRDGASEGRPAAGAYARLEVRDDGAGMSPELQSHIFEPFFTTKEIETGSGLGLWMVHRIVSDLGGYIAVASREGAGTKVTVWLPLQQEEAACHAVERAVMVGGRESIMVVDDEPMILKALGKMLGRLGYGIEVFLSSAEALKEFTARPSDFDLLITDLTMPGLDGKELTELIWAKRPRLPVLICTGYPEENLREWASGRERVALGCKPLSQLELSILVREALGKR